jgi:flagellar basal-body rod modification protein FlgD
MITAVNSTTGTSAATATMNQSMGMSSTDFLKLFVAQLQNQDPLNPQDPSAMLNQLAQMSLVQQSYSTNTALSNLLTAQNNSTSVYSSSLIGKNITASGNSVSFDGSSPTALQFSLPVPTSSATVTISDGSGNTVRTASLGALSAGNAGFAWDGRNSGGVMLPAGNYTYAVTATSASGSAVAATTYTSGLVSGVDLSGATPNLMIGSTAVPLTNVISVNGA